MISHWSIVTVVAFVTDWIVKIGFLLYLPRKRKPNAAIAWLLVIFLVPWLGIALFLIIGSPKLSRRRREIQKSLDELIANAASDFDHELDDMSVDKQQRVKPVINLNQSLGKLPVRGGNSVQILPEYDDSIADIIQEIEKSCEFIHLEYFIIALDDTTQPIFDALGRAVKRGVKVRILFDTMGSRTFPRRKEMKKLLTLMGAEWYTMLPFTLHYKNYNRPDLRNHRKILVIDDSIAYIGSQNLIDRTYHRKDTIYYNELTAKITGPVVRQCAVIFVSDWFAETGQLLTKAASPNKPNLPAKTGNIHAQIVPSGPSYETQNIARLFVQLIHMARNQIIITNPYVVPDEPLLNALTSAAQRGVEVVIVNSEAMDQWMVGHAQRSYYKELMKSGVKIYLYKSPVLLHSKHMTIDDDIAVIGSSNMDIRSFELDLECVLVTYDKSVVDDLRRVQSADIKHCTLIDPEAWNHRRNIDKFRDSIARLTSALQ